MEEKLIMGDSDSVTQEKCSNCHWWEGRKRELPRQSDFCNLTVTDEVEYDLKGVVDDLLVAHAKCLTPTILDEILEKGIREWAR